MVTEVGRSAVVSENDSHVKRTVFSPKILAKAVFADPALTLALPARRDLGEALAIAGFERDGAALTFRASGQMKGIGS